MRWLVLFPFISACASTGTTAASTSQTEIRATLGFSVEGIAYQGWALVQRKSSQRIVVSVPEKAVRLIFRSCHREEEYKNPAREWSTYYVPRTFLENWGSCVVTISVVTQKGNLLQGFIDFTSNETLPATNYCNGAQYVSATGASFCQAREGLIQRLVFDESGVEGEGKAGCPALEQNGREFTYTMARGLCIYAFRTKAGKTHRLTTRGYNQLSEE